MKNSLVLMSFTLLLVCTSKGVESQTLEFDKNTVFEYQTKALTNSNDAKNNLGQNWRQENLDVFYANASFNLNIDDYKFQGTWLFRESKSTLFGNNYSVFNHALYPQKIIARDLFKLQYLNETSETRTESVLNQFFIEFGDSEFHFKTGRFYINFGEGEIINPINPYNIAGSYSHHAKFNQGNDGLQVKMQKDSKLIFYVYLLGDRSYESYRKEKITRTLMLRGDWQYKPDTKITYILGEDQRRHKYGLQVKKSFEKGIFFLQSLRFSQKLNQEAPSEKGLFHYLVGGEYDINQGWTTRLEWGKFSFPDDATEAARMNHSYIPMSSVLAWINEYRFSEKAQVKLSYALDSDSGFSFYRFENVMRPKKTLEIFSYLLSKSSGTTKKSSIDTLQDSIGQELGIGIRFFH